MADDYVNLPEDQQALNDVFEVYPGLKNTYKNNDDVAIVHSDDQRKMLNQTIGGGGGLEFWSKEEPGEEGFPNPVNQKKVALEFYDPSIKQDPIAYRRAIFGDLLHGLDNDPKWGAMRDDFSKNFSQPVLDMFSREKRDPASKPEIDAWIRGYMAPDKNNEFWKSYSNGSQTWTPKQMMILKNMKNYLKQEGDINMQRPIDVAQPMNQ